MNQQGQGLPPPPVAKGVPTGLISPKRTLTPAPAGAGAIAKKSVLFGKLEDDDEGHRIVLYGPGGIGKTTLACSLPGPVAFFDLDNSLKKLKRQLDERRLSANIVPIPNIKTWGDIRNALQGDGWDNIKTIIIDTATKAEEMAIAWMFENVKNNGTPVSRLEDYGYKSGYRHLFDTYSLLLADLDAHTRAGRNVVLICHECAAKVPNPQGLDWIRYEPRLSQDDKNCQLRLRVKEWADHVLAFLYDVNVEKGGKGQGSGTRTIYASELPTFMAKSRPAKGEFPVVEGENFWTNIIETKE